MSIGIETNISWNLHEASHLGRKMTKEESKRFVDLSLKVDNAINRVLRAIFGVDEHPEQGVIGTFDWVGHNADAWGTYYASRPDTRRRAIYTILEHWGDSNGGDLHVNGLFDEKIGDLIHRLETFYGLNEYDEPYFMFRINFENIKVINERTGGVVEFNPLHDDEEEFEYAASGSLVAESRRRPSVVSHGRRTGRRAYESKAATDGYFARPVPGHPEHVHILDSDGYPATRMDGFSGVYPIDLSGPYPVSSDLSVAYEHLDGIILTVALAKDLGIPIERW